MYGWYEALALTTDRIGLASRVIVFGALKKRRSAVSHAVPVPPKLTQHPRLDTRSAGSPAARLGQGPALARELNERVPAGAGGHRIAAAGIPDGPHACLKGLRHGFGMHAVSKGIALNMVQQWLGYAQLTTTAIYADAVGEEEQNIAARMW